MLRASSVGLVYPSRTVKVWSTCSQRHIFLRASWQLPFPKSNFVNLGGMTTHPHPRFYSHNSNHDVPKDGKQRTAKSLGKTQPGQESHQQPDVVEGPNTSPQETLHNHGGPVISSSEDVTEEVRDFMLEEDVRGLHTLRARSSPGFPQSQDKGNMSSPTGRHHMREIKEVYYPGIAKILNFIRNDIDKEWGAFSATDKTVPVDEDEREARLTFPHLTKNLRDHLDVLARTQDADQAWSSYTALVEYIMRVPIIHRHLPHIPYAHLHRLSRVIASNRPKTHRQYLRLLAVLTYLKHSGGIIRQHQYNTLVDHAGQGLRKTRMEELSHAKRVAEIVQKGRLPGLTEEANDLQNDDYVGLEPDIYTYTILITTAARAMNMKEIMNVANVMQRAGLPPNRITHLSLLRFFTQSRNLNGVRATLQKMRAQELEIGSDGLNAVMWAYGKNGHVDVVLMIYRLLRHNELPETYEGPRDVREVAAKLAEEYIFVEPELRPDEITFTMLIQVMAYNGHFQAVLDVFQDMLTSENRERLHPSSSGSTKLPCYTPTLAVYRNIFLGFCKHGAPFGQEGHGDRAGWSLANLSNIFERFLLLPRTTKVSYANFDIIMKALAVTSNRNYDVMRDAWTRLEGRFGPAPLRPNTMTRMTHLKMKLFPEQYPGRRPAKPDDFDRSLRTPTR